MSAGTVPVLLLSLADAVWDSGRVGRAVAGFAPCLGSVDLSWTPEVGVDIFEPQVRAGPLPATLGPRCSVTHGLACICPPPHPP